MRILVTLFFLGFTFGAHAASPDYELYILVCDTAHCHRTAAVTLGSEGQRSDYRGAGISLRLDTLTSGVDVADVRLTLDIVPKLFIAGMPGAPGEGTGKVSVQVEPRTLRPLQFSSIATFTNANKIYQVWGRLAGPPVAAGNGSFKTSCANC